MGILMSRADKLLSKGISNIIEKIKILENWASKTKNNYPIKALLPILKKILRN